MKTMFLAAALIAVAPNFAQAFDCQSDVRNARMELNGVNRDLKAIENMIRFGGNLENTRNHSQNAQAVLNQAQSAVQDDQAKAYAANALRNVEDALRSYETFMTREFTFSFGRIKSTIESVSSNLLFVRDEQCDSAKRQASWDLNRIDRERESIRNQLRFGGTLENTRNYLQNAQSVLNEGLRIVTDQNGKNYLANALQNVQNALNSYQTGTRDLAIPFSRIDNAVTNAQRDLF